LSGPVTESNGLRERIASPLVACGSPTQRSARRVPSAAHRKLLAIGSQLRSTTCMMPCASKNAARALSARITAQKWRLRAYRRPWRGSGVRANRGTACEACA